MYFPLYKGRTSSCRWCCSSLLLDLLWHFWGGQSEINDIHKTLSVSGEVLKAARCCLCQCENTLGAVFLITMEFHPWSGNDQWLSLLCTPLHLLQLFFNTVPFHDGYGLLTVNGIPKPAYRAFQLLHRLGNSSIAAKWDAGKNTSEVTAFVVTEMTNNMVQVSLDTSWQVW